MNGNGKGNERAAERTGYRYPAGLQGRAAAGFWRLRDLAVIGGFLPFALLLAARLGVFLPLGGCAGFALLSARPDGGVSVFDVLSRAGRYLLLPRVYVWRPSGRAETQEKGIKGRKGNGNARKNRRGWY